MNIDAPLRTQIPLLRSLWKEAFHDTDTFLNAFYQTAYSNQRCLCVTVGEQVAAALYWFDCMHNNRRVAYLYAVATAKEYRGQGICHRLIRDTHLHLAKLGYEGTLLVPGTKKLFTLYEGIGYQTCSHIREFHCTGAEEAVSFRRIDKTKYAVLRRQLLPKDGILQENENLDFLQTQAIFYAGPNFLLTARPEADTLYGIELLGDATAMPGIIHSLGYSHGTFRVPGGDKPFAMYCPLGNSTLPPPTYFGLAFD